MGRCDCHSSIFFQTGCQFLSSSSDLRIVVVNASRRGMVLFRDRKTVESSDDSDDDDDAETLATPTAIRTKHDLMMKTEVCVGTYRVT